MEKLSETSPENTPEIFPKINSIIYTSKEMPDDPIEVFPSDDDGYFIKIFRTSGNEWCAKNEYSGAKGGLFVFLKDYNPEKPIQPGDGVKILRVDTTRKGTRVGEGEVVRKAKNTDSSF